MRMNTDREHSEQQMKQSRWGFRGKTVWDWMSLLIVPLALVVIGLVFTMLQDARQQEIEDKRAQQAQRIENQRAEAERELAEQRAQDEALQAYLDQMGSLLLERDLRTSKEDSEVRTLARARTLTVLGRLDPSRKTAVMQFLAEAKLLQNVEGRGAIITFSGADLSGANLTDAADNLSGADLSDADLSGANLQGACGLSQEQIDLTRDTNKTTNHSKKTELPERLNRPQWWSESFEEQSRIVQKAIYDAWLKRQKSGEDGENSDPS
jgi:hypothetical protein